MVRADQVKAGPLGPPRSGLAWLELSEPAIMLGAPGTTGVPGDGGSVRAFTILAVAIQGSSRFCDLVCLPDQTHIRSSRAATAPGFRLRRRTRPFFVAAFEAMQSIGSSTRIFRG